VQVINIGSIDGLRVPPFPTYAYAASKAGLHHLTRVLARELGPRRITVNAVAPGPFESKMMAATLQDVRGCDRRRGSAEADRPPRRHGRRRDLPGLMSGRLRDRRCHPRGRRHRHHRLNRCPRARANCLDGTRPIIRLATPDRLKVGPAAGRYAQPLARRAGRAPSRSARIAEKFAGVRRPPTSGCSAVMPRAAWPGHQPRRRVRPRAGGASGRDLRLAGPGRRPLVVSVATAWYWSITLAGMRPRSLTAMPWSLAQARISPLR
jgi:Enoyl-(Acyl carrier protein) reductase